MYACMCVRVCSVCVYVCLRVKLGGFCSLVQGKGEQCLELEHRFAHDVS